MRPSMAGVAELEPGPLLGLGNDLLGKDADTQAQTGNPFGLPSDPFERQQRMREEMLRVQQEALESQKNSHENARRFQEQEAQRREEERRLKEEEVEQKRLEEAELRRMQEEVRQQGIELRKKQYQERIRLEQERQRQEEERRREEAALKKLEAERRIEEAEETAKALQADVLRFIEAADALAKEASAKVPAIVEAEDDDETLTLCDAFDPLGEEAAASSKRASEFMAGKYALLQGAKEATKQETLQLIKRSHLVRKAVEAATERVKSQRKQALDNKEKEAKRVAAIKAKEKQESTFKQYDVDSDGLLSAADVVELVKGEYNFQLPLERAELMLQSETLKHDAGKHGVPYSRFPQLKLLIGIARDEARLKQKKLEAEERDRREERQCELVAKSAAETMSCLSGIEAEVAKAEQKARPLIAMGGGRSALPPEMVLEAADAVDGAVEAAGDFLAAAREQAQRPGGEDADSLEPKAAQAARVEARRLFMLLDRLELRLGRCSSASKACRNRILVQQRKAGLMRDLELAASAATARGEGSGGFGGAP